MDPELILETLAVRLDDTLGGTPVRHSTLCMHSCTPSGNPPTGMFFGKKLKNPQETYSDKSPHVQQAKLRVKPGTLEL